MRIKIITLLLLINISIIFMTIGYSALNTNLSISGNANVNKPDTIKISNTTINKQVSGAYLTYTPTFTNNSTNIAVTLPNSESSIILDIEITNDTSDNYHLKDIIKTLDTNPSIEYNFINEDILFFKPNSVSNIQVEIKYKWGLGTMNNSVLNFDYIFKKVNFEKLDYIISTGTQYIDTGVSNTGDYRFESDFLITNYTQGSGIWIFSGRKVPEYSLGIFVSHAGGVINGYGANNVYYEPKLPLNTWHSLIYSRTENKVGPYTYPVVGGKLIPEAYAANILLGGNVVNYDLTVDTRHFSGYMKYFKITDVSTNKVIRYFIPVKMVDTNEVLYLEVIDNKFYKNIGTGIFTGI